MLKKTITAKGSLPNESKTDSFTKPPFLAISEHSYLRGSPEYIRELLMSSQADSHVNRSASQESKQPKTTPATCGQRPLRSFAWLDRDTRSWKTSQGSLLPAMGISEPSCKDWPKSGTMRDGACYRQGTAVPGINENDYGSSLPTPVAYDATPGGPNNHYHGLGHMAKMNKWPTPMGRDWRTATGREDRHSPNLNVMVKRHQPTHGGQLNPMWVEWLMGWPLGWTDLKPLETDKFRSWLRLHGDC